MYSVYDIVVVVVADSVIPTRPVPDQIFRSKPI